MKLSFSTTMLLGGLLYGKLALLLHWLINDEPGMRIVFNLFYSYLAIVIGIVAKAIEYRRAQVRAEVIEGYR